MGKVDWHILDATIGHLSSVSVMLFMNYTCCVQHTKWCVVLYDVSTTWLYFFFDCVFCILQICFSAHSLVKMVHVCFYLRKFSLMNCKVICCLWNLEASKHFEELGWEACCCRKFYLILTYKILFNSFCRSLWICIQVKSYM